MEQKFTNRLINETSPYLRQHAHNSVDWYPWGPEALETARNLDRPIFLSIGYSSCHWCHVMERESFENEETAQIMNSKFINIKVDREERPDIDSIYMDFVQMTTRSGGWPLSVFLTPQLLPFFGGTYFPPQPGYGRPDFQSVLNRVSDFYHEKKREIAENGPRILAGLTSMTAFQRDSREADIGLLQESADRLIQVADRRHGGFGAAPKFPSSMALSFLLKNYRRRGDALSIEIVAKSLDEMAKGGIYDQLGGGFHRYSTDEYWLVPHFEKMLYDNALLARTYLEAYQVTGSLYYREVVEETLNYVQRDLSHPEGGFYSAEDADSEGVEGKFYVWEEAEIDQVLDPRTAEIFKDHFGVAQNGNWEGQNILHRRRDITSHARQLGWEERELKQVLGQARKRLLEIRDSRVRPGLDDKILASWNGLMLCAFSEAAFVLQNDQFLATAKKNADFLESNLISGGRLFRSWKEGEAKIPGFLDDYAFVSEAFLRLFQVTGEQKWLSLAIRLTRTLFNSFWDEEKGYFYFSSAEHKDLLIRPVEFFDNAIPSGNSTTAGNLLLLSTLVGDRNYRKIAERMLSSMTESCKSNPLSFSNWLSVIDYAIGPVYEIVILGPEKSGFLCEAGKFFIPNRILLSPDSVEGFDLPLLEGKMVPPTGAVAYLCKDFECKQPAVDIQVFRQQLRAEFG